MTTDAPFLDQGAGLRAALRILARPVAVVTSTRGEKKFAMAATAFCEVSMDPPTMLLCINRSNATHAAVAEGSHICLNLLAEDQGEVSRRCGGGVPADERFLVGDWRHDEGCPPRLADACASIMLRPVRIVEHATHSVVIGEVTSTEVRCHLLPLAFHGGGYVLPLARAALNLVANSAHVGDAGEMRDGFLMLDVMRAFYWFDEGLQSALRARGWEEVSRSQSMAFANIALGVRRPIDLARNLGITRQGVSKMLQEMVEREWIAIEPDPTDKRASIVVFSEKSQQLRNDALEILAKIDKDLATRIGRRTFETLRATLARDWGPPPEITADASAQ
ncbi:flavin reductase [Sphingopyxis sp.]|uniref:flavin reductase n=1 Tax=Sphingopyxis sp. TaxID=1908224 RepID=UPI003D6CC734